MEKILVITKAETNRFADERFNGNGGGYHQPKYIFSYKGAYGEFLDSSCGDFGTRFFVALGGKEAYFGSMLEIGRMWSDFTDSDIDFLAAFKEEFGISIPTADEIIDWKKEA